MPPAEGFAHGTRSRYKCGCRCGRCSAANTAASRARRAAADAAADAIGPPAAKAGPCPGVNREPCRKGSRVYRGSRGGVCETCRFSLIFNGTVDVAPVLEHLAKLSKRGVGYKAAADAASVARSTVGKLLAGKKTALRADTARRLLAVDTGAIADGGYVSSRPTWRWIRKLLAAGVTKARIAQQALGCKVPALQLKHGPIRASSAHAVEKFARRELGVLQLIRHRCPLCGYTHEGDREAAEYCFAAIARGVTSHSEAA